MNRQSPSDQRSTIAYFLSGLGTVVFAYELFAIYLTYEIWYLATTNFCQQFVLFGNCGFYTYVVEDAISGLQVLLVSAVLIAAGLYLKQNGRRELAGRLALVFGGVILVLVALTVIELLTPGAA